MCNLAGLRHYNTHQWFKYITLMISLLFTGFELDDIPDYAAFKYCLGCACFMGLGRISWLISIWLEGALWAVISLAQVLLWHLMKTDVSLLPFHHFTQVSPILWQKSPIMATVVILTAAPATYWRASALPVILTQLAHGKYYWLFY